jgi:DNA recombination protein RmuC
MESVIFWIFVGAIFAGAITWLALRAQTATLEERLMGRNRKVSELEADLVNQSADLSLAKIESAQARQELMQSETRLVEERKASAEKLAILNEAQAKLSDAFKALSSEALQKNNAAFLNLANATLEKFQEGARHDLDKRQVAIDQLVRPTAGLRSRCADWPTRRSRSSAKLRTS